MSTNYHRSGDTEITFSHAAVSAESIQIQIIGFCFFINTNILHFQISQGSIATHLRWGGSLYNRSVENFLRNLTVKELWKSVFTCRSYDQTQSGCFLEHGVMFLQLCYSQCTLTVHNSFTLSLPAWNTHVSQILPTVFLWTTLVDLLGLELSFVVTARSEFRKVLFWRRRSVLFCLCMKYLGNRWTDLRQIYTEDVFDPSVGRPWRSRSKVKVTGTKTIFFGTFGGLRAVYVWWSIFSL